MTTPENPPAFPPSPWRICYDGQIDGANGGFVCGFRWDTAKEFTDRPEYQATARLIAAAPDLLEALKETLHGFELMACPECQQPLTSGGACADCLGLKMAAQNTAKKARAAIARATKEGVL